MSSTLRPFLTWLVLLSLFACPAGAGAKTSTSATLLDHGILASGDGLAGKRINIVRRTTRIPGREGMAFGILFRLEADSTVPVSYHTVISFRPARGVVTGQPNLRLSRTHRASPGETVGLWHRLDAEQAKLAGQWILRVSCQGRRLLEQSFFVFPE